MVGGKVRAIYSFSGDDDLLIERTDGRFWYASFRALDHYIRQIRGGEGWHNPNFHRQKYVKGIKLPRLYLLLRFGDLCK